MEQEQKPLTTGVITQWPDLCGCCQQCVPSCLCSFFCVPCFAAQVGSHAGWNPNWGGCHQNGPRPASLCQKIFVKLIVVFAAIVVTNGISGGLRQANASIALANALAQENKCLWASPGTANTEIQCSDIGPPCEWTASNDQTNAPDAPCRLSQVTLAVMVNTYYGPGYASLFFNAVTFIVQMWGFVLLFHLRVYLHTIYPSGGDDCCMDCLCTWFCAPCALSQQARLVFKYEQNPQYATCSVSDPGPMDSSSVGSQQQNQQPYQQPYNGIPTAEATVVVASATVVTTDY